MLTYLIKIFTAIFIALGLSLGVLICVFYYYGSGLPNYQQLAHYKPPVVTRLYASDGRLFGEYAWEKRIYIPIQAIPKRVIQAFLAAEDKNFYHHSGIDIPSIISATVKNIGRVADSKRPIGASTITQQVAKNFLLTDIAHAVSYERKIKEAILAFRIENTFSKDYILELFLNEIYLGSGSYGVAAAALNYFNKSLEELTIAEAAYLAGLPKAPSRYHPYRYPQEAKIRRDYVVRRLLEEGYVSTSEAQQAANEPILIKERDIKEVVEGKYFAEEVRRLLIEKFGEKVLYQEGLVVRTSLDPFLQNLAQEVLRQGLESYDQRHGWRGPIIKLLLTPEDLKVSQDPTAALSSGWSAKLKAVVAPSGSEHWQLAVVLGLDPQQARIGLKTGQTGTISLETLKWARRLSKEGSYGPLVKHPQDALAVGDVILVDGLKDKENHYKLCQIPLVSGGLVAMDPHTGRILAMQGGYNFSLSQFNRVTQAHRQMGSSFKSFVYLAALEKGLSPSALLYDGPMTIDLGKGLGTWSPHNYEEDYMGQMTLRRSLELSRNLVAVRLTHDILGMKPIRAMVAKLDVVEDLPLQLAMVLGAAESTLLKVTTAYGMIVNGGRKIKPTLLDRIQDRHGKNLYINEGQTCEGCKNAYWLKTPPQLVDHRPTVLDPVTAYQMVSLLQGAVERGTARALYDPNRPLAGKTGTSNDWRDAWFVGFSPDLVVGVYIGFDTPRTLGKHESGARLALPFFKSFMQQALKDTPAVPFRVPPGLKFVRVNPLTGQPATESGTATILEGFRSGAEDPQELASPFDVLEKTDPTEGPVEPIIPFSEPALPAPQEQENQDTLEGLY